MHDDLNFWCNLQWPASPNDNDVQIFKEYSYGKTLLLGSTKQLLTLCDEAWDLNPKYDNCKIIHKDWLTINEQWDTIIGDGVLCFDKTFTDQLLTLLTQNCDNLVIRSFLNPSWVTKYATYFPRYYELDPQPTVIPINNIYAFYIWNR